MTYQLTFAKALPEPERERIRKAAAAIRTSRRSRPRPSYARARARWEAAGAAALAESDRRIPTSRAVRWLVRIYYVSEGGELLCFDAGPFVRTVADNLRSEYKSRQVYVPSKWAIRRPKEPMYVDAPGQPPSPEVFDRAEIDADAQAQGWVRQPVAGARLVVLPSQVYRPVECGVPDTEAA